MLCFSYKFITYFSLGSKTRANNTAISTENIEIYKRVANLVMTMVVKVVKNNEMKK